MLLCLVLYAQLMKKYFFIITLIILTACSPATKTTITETEYKQSLGTAICQTVNDLNSRGVLADEKVIEKEFDTLIQHFIQEMEYSSEEWLIAKEKYFPDEAEHTKLVKMHFTWCLMGY
jgi:hypothetical protein